MVKKNVGGGNKHKKKKNTVSDEIERELSLKDNLQEYGQITKLLGNCRLEVHCFDGKNRLGHIRGTMRKKVWISVNDIVIVSLREFEDDKCDILHKYLPKEINRLKAIGEIPDTVKINEEVDEKDDIGIDFEEEEDVEINIEEI